MTEHFTAWLTNDPSCLDGENCDLVVLADEIAGYKTDRLGYETDDPDWTSVGNPLMYAVTTVSARDGDDGEAARQAEALLADAGWRITGSWDAVTTGYVVDVERERD